MTEIEEGAVRARTASEPSEGRITIVPLDPVRDFSDLADGYWKHWGEMEDPSPVVGCWWLAKTIERSTFGFAACLGDALVGAVTGRIEGAPGFDLTRGWAAAADWAQSAEAAHGPDALRLLRMLERCNRQMLADADARGRHYRAELTYLWVDASMRGRGLSKSLVAAAHAAMREAGAEEYMLFTDNHCSLAYYERAPWEKAGEIVWTAEPGEEPWFEPGSKSLMYARRID